MGAFKIQTDLDLSGFNLLNFCIQSYTDLANVPNLGLGRKLFFTGNSTDKKNLREVIWDGDKWKAAVYLDDIEALTNGEGSLGTRVKALEDMLGLQDVTDVIDTWNDVKEFFANVDEGLNLMTMLDGKAEWSTNIPADSFKCIGYGTLGTDWIYNGPALSFGANSTYYAQLQINFQADQIVFRRHTTEGFSNWVSILHKNNFESIIGDTYLKTTGGTISSGEWAKQLVLNNNNSAAAGLRFHMNDEMMGILYMSSSHKLFFHDGTTPNLEVLHSGNVGDYTVGAAKKLAPFYGSITRPRSADVEPLNDGSVYAFMATSTMTVGKPAYDGFILNFEWDNSGYISQLFLGNGSVAANNPDKRMQARVNTSNGWSDWKTVAFTDSTVAAAKKIVTASGADVVTTNGTDIITAGSVTIPNGRGIFSYKNDSISVLEIMSVSSNNNLSIGYSLSGVGGTYLFGDSITFRTGGSRTTAMTITDGGNVLVGVASQTNTDFKFEVSGLSRIYTAGQSMSLGKVPTNGLVLGSSTGLQGQFYFDYSGNICLQGQSVSDSTTRALNLNPLGGAVNVGGNLAPNANNSLSLGTSSYRWSNVYSVGGNFSGRVLIGGTIAEENFKLSVAGAVKITRPNDTTTYLGITVSDVLTTFNGVDTSDGYMRYSFQSHGTELLHLDGRANGTSYFRTLVGFDKLATFNGGALIPTGQTLTIGSVTFRETAAGEVEVDGNLHTTGTLASGGKATVGEGDNGGGGNANVYSDVLEGVITQEWEVGNPFQKEDVIVSLYMWNTDESRWKMFLADIGVTSENIWVTFGRPTSTSDKFMAVVMG